MYFQYETDRLILKVLDEFYGQEVLDFYKKNKEIFSVYDAMKPGNYYTKRYQEEVLRLEYQTAVRGQGVRFYVFLKQEPETLVGTVSLQGLQGLPYESGTVGYRFDKDFHGKGYALEAVGKLVDIGFHELNLHRISAYVQRDNVPSIKLLEKLDFQWEGTIRSYAKIGNQWKDHELYGLVKY